MITLPSASTLRAAMHWARWIGCRWDIMVPVPRVSVGHTEEIADRMATHSMWVLSVPSMPWGSKTRWSRTHTESKPSDSASFDPSMHFSTDP